MESKMDIYQVVLKEDSIEIWFENSMSFQPDLIIKICSGFILNQGA